MVSTNQLIDRRTLALRMMRCAYKKARKDGLVDSDIHKAHLEDITIDKSLVEGFMIYTLETVRATYKVSMDLKKFIFIATIENLSGEKIYSNIFGF